MYYLLDNTSIGISFIAWYPLCLQTDDGQMHPVRMAKSEPNLNMLRNDDDDDEDGDVAARNGDTESLASPSESLIQSPIEEVPEPPVVPATPAQTQTPPDTNAQQLTNNSSQDPLAQSK